jgi:hypothetical protein
MHFVPNRFALLAVVAFLACSAFGDPVQTGESNTDLSGGMQLKWMGKSLPGNVLNVGVLLSLAMLPDTLDGKFSAKTSTALVSLDFHPQKILDLKLSMPFLVKQGPEGFTGPFGDMFVDICKKWGKDENLATALAIGFPTGYSAIQKLNAQQAFDGVTFLNPENEPGNGLFTAQVRASYAFLPDWGFVNLGGAYSAGLFAVRTTEYGYDTLQKTISHVAMEFQVARDGLGATNEAGVLTPDRLSLFTDFGFKTEMLIHCFSIGYFHPLESGRINQLTQKETALSYSTRDSADAFLQQKYTNPDTTFEVVGQRGNGQWVYLQKTTSSLKTVPFLTLQYNVEKSDMTFPMFIGAMVKLDFDKNVKFGGLAVGLGFKFPVY